MQHHVKEARQAIAEVPDNGAILAAVCLTTSLVLLCCSMLTASCLRRALTEMQHDVKEAREAIAEVADNNAILAAVCLTEGATALDWSTTSHKPLHM